MASSAAGNAGKNPQARCANAFEVAQVRAGRVPGRSKTLFDFPMVRSIGQGALAAVRFRASLNHARLVRSRHGQRLDVHRRGACFMGVAHERNSFSLLCDMARQSQAIIHSIKGLLGRRNIVYLRCFLSGVEKGTRRSRDPKTQS
jgi:hypothetical protein